MLHNPTWQQTYHMHQSNSLFPYSTNKRSQVRGYASYLSNLANSIQQKPMPAHFLTKARFQPALPQVKPLVLNDSDFLKSPETERKPTVFVSKLEVKLFNNKYSNSTEKGRDKSNAPEVRQLKKIDDNR